MSLQPILRGFQELNSILNSLKLPTALNCDNSVLNWVQSEVQFLNHLLVENYQLISIAGGIEARFFNVDDHAVCHLMPHFLIVISFKFSNFLGQDWEFGLVLIKKSSNFRSG